MGETVSPSGAAEAAEETLIPAEPARKLWRFTPLFSAGVVYDDNIEFSNTNRVPDVIWTISGGLAFELGDFRGGSGSENYLSAFWLGSPVFYTDNPDQNNFNQIASLIGQYRWSKLVADSTATSLFREEATAKLTRSPRLKVFRILCGSNTTTAKRRALI